MNEADKIIMERKAAGMVATDIAWELTIAGHYRDNGKPWDKNSINSRAAVIRNTLRGEYVQPDDAKFEETRRLAMEPAELTDYQRAIAVRAREKQADERRRSRLADRLERLRAEADALGAM